jgi:hypothetical protein
MSASTATGQPVDPVMTARVVAARIADEDHAVVCVEGGSGAYRRRPCDECPWRVDQAGSFPAEAFRLSAPTAYDLSTRVFGCHMSPHRNPLTCAGFLLRAGHNLAIRFRQATAKVDLDQVSDGGHELFDNYRDMAIANGVDADDLVIGPCR